MEDMGNRIKEAAHLSQRERIGALSLLRVADALFGYVCDIEGRTREDWDANMITNIEYMTDVLLDAVSRLRKPKSDFVEGQYKLPF